MKKTIKLAVAAALALGATSAFATNGSNLIGVGAKARGMGGVGIAVSHGAESALANPALITSVKDTEVAFAGTIFMPNVENSNIITAFGVPASTSKSDANMNVIPSVSIASKVADGLYFGVGMWGTAGMGVDYRDGGAAQLGMVTNLQLMQFGVPLAYTTNGLSIAITPVLQYGSLDIEYSLGTDDGNPLTGPGNVGMGVAQDLKFGVNFGLAYEIQDITIGATYKSQIDMQYKGMKTVMAPFTGGLGYNNDNLSTPAEIGVGVAYKMSEHTIAFDYKNIAWSSAKGYEDFAWEDQNVYAIGYEYATTGWAVRAGYNYSESPIKDKATSTAVNNNINGATANTLNLLGFPATVESHVTLGGTYNANDKTSFDLAFAYAPETSNTFNHFAGEPMTVKHSQTSVSVGVNFAF